MVTERPVSALIRVPATRERGYPTSMDSASDADRHRYYEALAVTHVLGGLSESDGRVFRSHLLDCPQCRARVGELRRIANDLADVERDERRMRAAKAVETKRRDDDDEEIEPEEPQVASRASRVGLLIGMVLLVGLASWNFLLRDFTAGLQRQLGEADIERDLLINDQEAQFVSPTGQFSSEPSKVLYSDSHALVVLDGVKENEIYAVYSQNAEDDAVNDPIVGRAESDRLTLLVPRVPGLRRLVVTRPEAGAEGRAPSGTLVMHATLVDQASADAEPPPR